MHYVTKSFPNLLANVFPKSNDMARRSHADDLSVVWHSIEGGMNQQPALAKQCLDVERHLHVGGIHVLVLEDDGIEFQ